jgi:hypothetical protein
MANVSSFAGAFPVIPGGLVEVARLTATGANSGTAVTQTYAAASNLFSSNATVVADGSSSFLVEVFVPLIYGTGSSFQLRVSLSQNGSEGGRLAVFDNIDAFTGVPAYGQIVLTPAAGTLTLNARIWTGNTAGALAFYGTGSGTQYAPAMLRVSKIVNQNDGLKPFWTPPVVTQLPSQANEGDQVLLYSSSPYAGYQTHQYASGSWRTLGDSRGVGAWQSWTPSVTQPGAVTVTQGGSRYVQSGKTVTANGILTVTGSGTSGNIVNISLPVPAAGVNQIVGCGWIYDASTATRYAFVAEASSTTTFVMNGDWSSSGSWGNAPAIGLASTDQIRFSLTYEAS